jgi:hypothetical protein
MNTTSEPNANSRRRDVPDRCFMNEPQCFGKSRTCSASLENAGILAEATKRVRLGLAYRVTDSVTL